MGDEALVLEWHERVESLEEGEDASEHQREVSEVRLEWLLTVSQCCKPVVSGTCSTYSLVRESIS